MSGPQGPVDPMQAADHPIDPEVRVGHVHLRTTDIGSVRNFYVGTLGFDVVFETRNAFLKLGSLGSVTGLDLMTNGVDVVESRATAAHILVFIAQQP